MNRAKRRRTIAAWPALVTLLLMSGAASAQSIEWPQWGGPQRDFKSDAKGLAQLWPADGPKRLWSRELGEGYSSIAASDGRLYTMYRKGDREVVIAMEAATGKTAWEYSYDAPFTKEYDMSNGPGPHATPTVAGNYVFTAGATSKMHCLDKQTGKPIWSRDLIKDFNGTIRVNGYSCSPLAYKNTVIMMVGGAGSAIVALSQKDGSVVWKKHDFKNSTSSPLLINVGGQDQVVAFMYDDIVGVDPNNGELLWSHAHPTDFGLNTSTPVWGEDNLLFVSSAYNGGSRVIRLGRAAGKTSAEEVWSHRLMRVHFTNVVRVGDFVYGSSGDFGPAPFTAVNVKTGRVAWRDRSLARASSVYVDGHFIILDEDGNLALATASPEGLTVQAKAALFSNQSWTAPTIAGSRLYARDRKSIVAVDLAAK